MTRGEAFNGKRRRQTYSQYNGKILFENVTSGFFLDNEYMGLLTEVALDQYLCFQNFLQCFQFNKHGLAISHHFWNEIAGNSH